MSADTVDDLHAAEDHADCFAEAGRAVLDAAEDHALTHALKAAIQALAGEVKAWEHYCRPSCGAGCDPETCGCHCHEGGEGD